MGKTDFQPDEVTPDETAPVVEPVVVEPKAQEEPVAEAPVVEQCGGCQGSGLKNQFTLCPSCLGTGKQL